MSLVEEGETIAHYPKNPDVFQFDADVARIFPDMAKRAICLYHEAHRAHVAMLAPWLGVENCTVLDIGASRGGFWFHVKQKRKDVSNIRYTAMDSSQPMLDLLEEEHPDARIINMDLLSPAFEAHDKQYDVVVCNYVLQFIPPMHQIEVLQRMLSRVKPGGIFIFGHKAASTGMLGRLAHEEYIEFRVRNGYSRKEIAAKSKALAGSMWPMNHETVKGVVMHAGFKEIVETTRWMMFNTFMAYKGE